MYAQPKHADSTPASATVYCMPQSWQHLLILIILYCLFVGNRLRRSGNFIKTKLAMRDLASLCLISLKMAGHIFLGSSKQ